MSDSDQSDDINTKNADETETRRRTPPTPELEEIGEDELRALWYLARTASGDRRMGVETTFGAVCGAFADGEIPDTDDLRDLENELEYAQGVVEGVRFRLEGAEE
jgi:hypothetical protein